MLRTSWTLLLVLGVLVACVPKAVEPAADGVGTEAADGVTAEATSDGAAKPDAEVQQGPEASPEAEPASETGPHDEPAPEIIEPSPDVAIDGEGDATPDDGACAPACDGHDCGDDGCGGSCGQCDDDGDACTGVWECVEGTCVRTVAPVTCVASDACHLAGMCDPATGLCDDPPKCPAGVACVAGQCCECSEGPCCDGCHFRSETTACEIDAVSTYVCLDGTGCGQDGYVRHRDRFCSGHGTACDGELWGGDEQLADDCADTEVCVEGAATCAASAACLPATPGFVTLAPGGFWMGSPSGEPCPEGYRGTGCPASGTTTEEPGRGTAETLHYVRLTHAFEVQAREVTQAEWESAFGSNPSWAGPNGAAPACGPDCPVERVSWLDALAYANRLSTAAGLVPCYLLEDCTDDLPGAGCAHDAILCSDPRGCTVTLNGVATPYECQGYRLPTEAEWEYAYRSGSVTALYPTDGNDGSLTQPNDTPVDPNLAQVGWYTANAGDGAHPGGTLEPNAWGLADMAGNVWEWCWGGYTGYPSGTLSSPAIDPVSDPWSTTVARGGAYSDWASYARAAFRGTFGIDLRAGKVGFRLVRTL